MAPVATPDILAQSASSTVLCVDLDGTLVKSDTLVDSALVLARQHPELLLRLPGWLMEGKASLKKHLTQSVQLDVEHLPYNRDLLQYLEQERAAGRTIYLATAADQELARRVAAHLGLFEGVIASDGVTNVAGDNKLAAFRQRFGDDFCYIGNASADVPLLRCCKTPMVANPTSGLRSAMQREKIQPVRVFTEQNSSLRSWLKALRMHQWAKNVLLFLPLLLSHNITPAPIVAALIAFLAFGLCASATYIVNDLLDIEADRNHPRKRRRPFAAGDLSAITGVGVIVLFLFASVALALAVPHIAARIGQGTWPASPLHFLGLATQYSFLGWLGIYTVTTLSYSLRLKRAVLVDVIVLSGLYTIRILAGAAATGIEVSTWLGSFSIFFFLSLAFVKRFAELENLRERGGAQPKGRGYHISDIEQLRSFGSASGYVSVAVLTLYISNLDAEQLYQHTKRLWLLVPVLLLWISRLWLMASRGELDEDPVVYAITDKRSLMLGVLVAVIVFLAL